MVPASATAVVRLLFFGKRLWVSNRWNASDFEYFFTDFAREYRGDSSNIGVNAMTH